MHGTELAPAAVNRRAVPGHRRPGPNTTPTRQPAGALRSCHQRPWLFEEYAPVVTQFDTHRQLRRRRVHTWPRRCEARRPPRRCTLHRDPCPFLGGSDGVGARACSPGTVPRRMSQLILASLLMQHSATSLVSSGRLVRRRPSAVVASKRCPSMRRPGRRRAHRLLSALPSGVRYSSSSLAWLRPAASAFSG